MSGLWARLVDALFGPRCEFGDGCSDRVFPGDRVGHWRARHDAWATRLEAELNDESGI